MVIGILIALQINNWNNYKKNRTLETETLLNLKLDLRTASEQLGNKIRQNKKFYHCDSILLQVIQEKKSIALDSLENLALCHLITPTFNPEMGTLNEIINTGKLNIIKNSDLRRHISNWNRYMENLNETTEKLKHFDINVRTPMYEDKIPVINWFYHHYQFGGFDYPTSNYLWEPEDLIFTLEFENMLANYVIFSGIQYTRLTQMERKINDMILLIDKETMQE